MNASEAYKNWSHFSVFRKSEIIDNLFNWINYTDIDRYDEFLHEVVALAEEFELEDYFGTEGLKL